MSPFHATRGRNSGLDRLARLAAAERERFARRWPRYRDRFLAATLAQGPVLHLLTGSTGVKDLDVVLLFAALPGERFPESPGWSSMSTSAPPAWAARPTSSLPRAMTGSVGSGPGGPTSTGAAGWTW
jgi:hypothetical protein